MFSRTTLKFLLLPNITVSVTTFQVLLQEVLQCQDFFSKHKLQVRRIEA